MHEWGCSADRTFLFSSSNAGFTHTSFTRIFKKHTPHSVHLIVIFARTTERFRIWVSSVSISSDYRLDDRTIKVWSPAEAKDFSSSLCVQTSFEVHSVSYPVIPESFPGVTRGRGVTLTTHPHLVPRSIMSRSYACSPPWRLMAFSETPLLQRISQLLGPLSLVSSGYQWVLSPGGKARP
jgi:hypothetical protein